MVLVVLDAVLKYVCITLSLSSLFSTPTLAPSLHLCFTYSKYSGESNSRQTLNSSQTPPASYHFVYLSSSHLFS